MNFNPDLHRRHSIRLTDYDYSSAGFYFITICVQGRESLLAEVVDGVMVLNDAGRMVENIWTELPTQYPGIAVDDHVIMPNHFHGIIVLKSPVDPPLRLRSNPDSSSVGAGPRACPGFDPGFSGPRREGHPQGGAPTTVQLSLPDVVHRFKSLTTHAYINGVKNHNWPPFPGKLWQRNYHERIIRNENELHNIRQYIHDNPQKWDTDNEKPTHNPL